MAPSPTTDIAIDANTGHLTRREVDVGCLVLNRKVQHLMNADLTHAVQLTPQSASTGLERNLIIPIWHFATVISSATATVSGVSTAVVAAAAAAAI